MTRQEQDRWWNRYGRNAENNGQKRKKSGRNTEVTQQIGDSWQQTRNKPATNPQQIHNNSVIRYKNGRNGSE